MSYSTVTYLTQIYGALSHDMSCMPIRILTQTYEQLKQPRYTMNLYRLNQSSKTNLNTVLSLKI